MFLPVCFLHQTRSKNEFLFCFTLGACYINQHERGEDQLIWPNIIRRCTTKALAISTLCRKALKKIIINRPSTISRIHLLFCQWSLATETSVIWDKEDFFFQKIQRIQRVGNIFRIGNLRNSCIFCLFFKTIDYKSAATQSCCFIFFSFFGVRK